MFALVRPPAGRAYASLDEWLVSSVHPDPLDALEAWDPDQQVAWIPADFRPPLDSPLTKWRFVGTVEWLYRASHHHASEFSRTKRAHAWVKKQAGDLFARLTRPTSRPLQGRRALSLQELEWATCAACSETFPRVPPGGSIPT